MGGKWNRDVGKMGMGMRCWTANGNDSLEWEGMGTTIVIPAHLYSVVSAPSETLHRDATSGDVRPKSLSFDVTGRRATWGRLIQCCQHVQP